MRKATTTAIRIFAKLILGILLWAILGMSLLIGANVVLGAEKTETWTEYNNGKKCTITAYCLCEKCCGRTWEKNLTYSGVEPKRYVTVANGGLPMGTRVYIEGVGYRTVQDTGSKVGKNHFDIYCGVQNHQVAKEFGLKKRRVWIVKEG